MRLNRTATAPWRIVALAVPFLIVLAAMAGVGEAQEGDRSALSVAKGRVTYRIYCTSCHGAKGMGDGKLAGFLVPKPTDLTALAEENGDQFPEERVRKVIDGRERVPGHGGGDMPAWGDVFAGLEEDAADAEAEAAVQERIASLVAFLESIQGENGE